MSNINGKAKEANTYDAIVIGTGISGGWAAKELCEKGLKTLVLERGPMVRHVEDYPTMHLDDWDLPNAGEPTLEDLRKQPKQHRTGYVTHQATKHFFVNDLEHPYSEVKRFDWIRGYHVGGRSLTWGRVSLRWSDLDFEANLKDGHGVDWPIRYKDIEPWYSYVEEHAGISGEMTNLPHVPNSKFLPPFPLNCVETEVRKRLEKAFGGTRHLLSTPRANLSQNHKGRIQCQYRNRCSRGCPYGAYFSSQASTLPAAEATGNMTLRPDSIVHTIIYDEATQKASGVRILDAVTNETIEYFAKIVFCNASALGTTQILLNSTSERFPNGLGNDSDALGRYLMDHHFRVGASGTMEGFDDKYYKGRRPGGFYIPRFRNLDAATKMDNFVRGYGYQGGASRENWSRGVRELQFGAEFKDALMYPGAWRLGMTAFGECLPYEDNRVYLNQEVKDKFGLPTLTIDCEFKENEMQMRVDMRDAAVEMLEKAGLTDINTFDDIGGPGLGIHEMGTARMGRDPKTSVLNGNNQVHAVPNVFVTDGACMTSAGCQNPSLTYMALTARAANFAVSELKNGNL